MAGIYIHIPFCRKACNYCDFHFSTSLHYRNDYVNALLTEIDHRMPLWKNEGFNTLYFGGGTPSQLLPEHLQLIFERLANHVNLTELEEITFEINPDDIHQDYLKTLRDLGVNRLSIGIQSFRDEDLSRMNRAHNADEAEAALHQAFAAGFERLSVDLIYGIPGLSDEDWLSNLNRAARAGINHLSCYALTVEQGTPLAKQIREKQAAAPGDEQAAQQFALLQSWANAQGFEHYEISNLARPGARAVHNSSYWKGAAYLGLGASAHGFRGMERYANVANNQRYIQAWKDGRPDEQTEQLSTKDRYNELILTGLRTSDGLSLQSIRELNEAFVSTWLMSWETSPHRSAIERFNDRFVLRPEFWFQADGIAADLFML